MTRARVVWSTSAAFAEEAEQGIRTALRRPRDRVKTAHDVREMRELMERERPPKSEWDLKLSPGGLVDIEFAAQFLQLAHAGQGGPLHPNTGQALAAFREAGLAPAESLAALDAAWRLQQNLTQLLKVALDANADPAGGAARLPRPPGEGWRGAGFPPAPQPADLGACGGAEGLRRYRPTLAGPVVAAPSG